MRITIESELPWYEVEKLRETLNEFFSTSLQLVIEVIPTNTKEGKIVFTDWKD